MIPIKLAMQNFMCYRGDTPPLDFNGIHTACLWGDNGNGKSAIIDAITWALWGQSRAKSDDELIHTGEPEMSVEFDFAVGDENYRIIRRRARPKRQRAAGQSILELQTAGAEGFQSITGNSIAQTQQKIINILHMDYDTFINSAYLRQGRADEFTNQAPAKRKEVLASILGLDSYDELEERARALAREKGTARAQLESAINDIKIELACQPDYAAELAAVQQELSGLEKTAAGQEEALKELRGQKEALEQKQAQLEQMGKHLAETADNLKHWDEQVMQHRSRLKEYEELLSRQEDIESGHSRFSEARKTNEELDQQFRRTAGLNDRKHRLEMSTAQAGQEVLKDHALTQGKIKELETRTEQLPNLKSQRQQAAAELRRMAEQETALSEKTQHHQQLQTEVNYLESSRGQLESEIAGIDEKIKLLSSPTGARCPLCETELGAQGLKVIEEKYAAERQEKTGALQKNRADLSNKRTALEALSREIREAETRLNRERTAAQSQASLLDREITEAEASVNTLEVEREKLAAIEKRLANKEFAAAEQEALREVEAELGSISYDAARHEEVRRQLNELTKYDDLKRKLDDAHRLIQQEKENAARAAEVAEKLRQNQTAARQKEEELKKELSALPPLLARLEQAEVENRQLLNQRNQKLETMWSAKAKLDRCAELEVKKQEKHKEMSLLSKDSSIYQDLAKAFGKGGVQALLIDAARPEIEAEANQLLARMTDNRMHVKFETQRETKKGVPMETLDINISDELGMRKYEMFSGGEAFRINFAIRIALSKILAKRAGAPLPTLIIDEGFGTQDTGGIDKLKEAINSIQDDFDKIIVITHIEELRDAFPTRIDVTKTAAGSTVSLN